MYLKLANVGGRQANCRQGSSLAVPDITDKKSGLLKHLARRNGLTTGA
jgi:hypothetical protein